MPIAAVAALVVPLLCVWGAAAEDRCPPGATVAGEAPPAGREQWCERRSAEGTALRHGRYVAWFEDGQKQAEIDYVDGQEHGRAVAWYPNGQKAAEGDYRKGERNGLWTRWYESGQKQAEAVFSAGTKHGVERSYDENGDLVIEVEWVNGEIRKATDGAPSSSLPRAKPIDGV